MLLLIVYDAPRIARIGVAALQLPMRGILADVFKAPNLRPLFLSPVPAVPWRQLIHTAKTALASAGSEGLGAKPRERTVLAMDDGAESTSGLSIGSHALKRADYSSFPPQPYQPQGVVNPYGVKDKFTVYWLTAMESPTAS